MTAVSFNPALYTLSFSHMKPLTPSFSYLLIHVFIVLKSTPPFRAASLMLILFFRQSRTIFTFSSTVNFCFCGITMLPLCSTVFCFTVSHRGSISDAPAKGRLSLWLFMVIKVKIGHFRRIMTSSPFSLHEKMSSGSSAMRLSSLKHSSTSAPLPSLFTGVGSPMSLI